MPPAQPFSLSGHFCRVNLNASILQTSMTANRETAVEHARAYLLGAADALVFLVGRREAIDLVQAVADEAAVPLLPDAVATPRGCKP